MAEVTILCGGRFTPAIIKAFWARVDKNGPLHPYDSALGRCWDWTKGTVTGGYGVIRVDRKPKAAHRVSFEMRNGAIPENGWVLHNCDNPKCLNPDHLYIGTPADNVRDREGRGRNTYYRGENHWSAKSPERIPRGENHWTKKHPEKIVRGVAFTKPERRARGERCGRAKLKGSQIPEIRGLWLKGGHRQVDIAKMFGVAQSLVGMIVRREIWKHIP